MRSLVGGAIVALLPLTLPADEAVRTSPAPDWILPVEDEWTAVDGEDGASHYHLVDFQHHVENRAGYEHYVIRILNEAGVEDFSQLDFDYQPAYETLHLHHITLEREGEVLDRLGGRKIEVLRREEDMESRLYDGELTALVILEDVRPGDILSYSFTRSGVNPVHAGHLHRFRRLGYGSEIDRIRCRVLWSPEARSLSWTTHGDGTPSPAKTEGGPLSEILWEQENVARISPESSTPGWVFDYPWLEYSDFPDWKSYVDHALTIYQQDQDLPGELREVCGEIGRDQETDEARILAALRWVQRHVRYLGSFFGQHTHAPYPLEDICRRRFGDCKDKGTLTVAMLRELGFDAAPALVNTSRRRGIREYLPGHSAFNHLVVHLRWNGRDYLLDPTHTYQRGSLDRMSSPDYRLFLPIRPGVTGLQEIEPKGLDATRTTIRETYRVDGLWGAARLEVRTVATGGEADSLRRYFAENSRATIEETYTDFYGGDFPGASTAEPLRFTDDPDANRVVIEESYHLPEFWSEDDDGSKWNAWVDAAFLRSNLDAPDAERRAKPYWLDHPNEIEQTIEVHLPEAWDIDEATTEIDHPAFRYRSSVEAMPKGFRMKNHYTSLASEVDAADFDDFVKSMTQVREDLSMNVWHHQSPDGGIVGASTGTSSSSLGAVIVGGGASVGLALGAVMALLLFFWDPPARVATTQDYRGLGGWLVLPIIGMFVLPLILVADAASYAVNLKDMAGVLESEGGFGGWRLYYLVGPMSSAFLLPTSILLLVLLFQRRTSLPWVYIGVAALALAVDLVLLGMEAGLDDLATEDGRESAIPGQVIRLLLWGWYMLASQRVKATFVCRRKSVPPALPAAVVAEA